MDILTHDDIRTLLEERDGPCISIYLPMERAGKETRQNAIRFKNALSAAEERLAEYDLHEGAIEEILKPLTDRFGDNAFWQHQSDGLAIFCAPGMVRSYRLPLDFEEIILVSDRFHLKPVLQLFTGNGAFYILALSQNNVRLLRATRYLVDEMSLPEDTPTSREEALAQDDEERQLQFRTNVPRNKGDAQAPAFHGHADADERVNLLRYFLEVDRGVQEVLKDAYAPLVLFGVDYLLPLYRERNNYPHLIEEGVTGNPDTLRPEEIHAAAWEVVQPVLERGVAADAEQYHELQSVERATGDLHIALPAAAYGRVESLFVPLGVRQWGQFDMTNSTVEPHDEPQRSDEDLLDLAAAHTLLNSGRVHVVPPEEIPGSGLLAAVLRY
jgi:hypothetical protein